jgi:beta-N-acetylhexosaminidase
MTDSCSKWVDNLLGKMNLEQKVGQMMVFGFCGPVITPDIVELIRKYHIGGLRVSHKFRMMRIAKDVKPGTEPDTNIKRSVMIASGLNRDYAYINQPTSCTAKEYARTLNTLREHALERLLGIPLHYVIDQEGSASDDMLTSQRLFPHPMGYAVAGDLDLAYRSGICVARQAASLGANVIHSPVLDVNTNPRNPEIGTRAFGGTPDIVTKYALQMMLGLRKGGLLTTGKHFPGRGESESDAHWGLPSVNLGLDELTEVHIRPYRELIANGLDQVMIAHCCYPSLGVPDRPACVAPEIVTSLLRERLGFEGVITTDNMMMGGVLKKYEMTDAVVKTIQAGCDVILSRDESPLRFKILDAVANAVRTRMIPESRIDESVKRILKMRYTAGLAANGGIVDVDKAGVAFDEPVVVATAHEAARKSVALRDTAGILPLSRSHKTLLIEQIFPTHEFANDMYSHPGLLWEQMCKHSNCIGSVEIPFVPRVQDRERIFRRLDEVDTVVMTNYYYHMATVSITDLVREVMATGKKVVVVTNTPYEFGAPADFPTVVVCFNPGGPENMEAVADVLYGKLIPTATLPAELCSGRITRAAIGSKR